MYLYKNPVNFFSFLGMLLTLLVLAVINGGTLAFNNNQQVEDLATDLDRVDINVGAISENQELSVAQ
jgi:hypothetical protein